MEFTEKLLALVEPYREAFRSRHPIAVLYEVGDQVPVYLNVKPDADPPMMANIRWHEELLRVGAYEHLLSA